MLLNNVKQDPVSLVRLRTNAWGHMILIQDLERGNSPLRELGTQKLRRAEMQMQFISYMIDTWKEQLYFDSYYGCVTWSIKCLTWYQQSPGVAKVIGMGSNWTSPPSGWWCFCRGWLIGTQVGCMGIRLRVLLFRSLAGLSRGRMLY